MKTILVDVDGVLVDWSSRYPFFLKDIGIDPTKIAEISQKIATGGWHSVGELTGLPEDEGHKLCDDFAQSPQMAQLAAYPDALQVVNRLKHHFKFVAITAIINTPDARKYRKENLDFWFPDTFDTIIHVGAGQSKLNELLKYEPTIWVDDSPSHITEGVLAGHHSIRLHRDTRTDNTPSFHANNWFDIENLIHLLK